jgi:hypothetical protein
MTRTTIAAALMVAFAGCGDAAPSCEELAPRMTYKQGRAPVSTLRECKVAGWSPGMRRCVAGAADHKAIVACADRFDERVAKPSEAMVMLPRIAEGALAAWKRDGAVPQQPTGVTPVVSCCAQNNNSYPCEPQPRVWATPAWRALGFEIDGPFKRQYAYVSEGKDAFTVTTVADYDCDFATVTTVLHGRIVDGQLDIRIVEPTNED